jgi:hypothetical protein
MPDLTLQGIVITALGELPEDLGWVMCNVAVTVARDPWSMEPARALPGHPAHQPRSGLALPGVREAGSWWGCRARLASCIPDVAWHV